MFSGTYLQYNIGHEAINLFQSDNGCYYVYINKDGIIGKEHFNGLECKVEHVLLARTLEGENAVEIIGLASGLEPVCHSHNNKESQKEYALEHNIQYGEVNINDIYSGGEQQDINISFKAEFIKRVADKKRIKIIFAPKGNQEVKELKADDVIKIQLTNMKIGQSPKCFIDNITNEHDYKVLKELIDKDDNWGESMPFVSKRDQELSYLDVCKSAYDELAYSNAMLYFAQKYPEITFELFDELIEKKDDHEDFIALREKKHMDLFFYNTKRAIVVENKIKSGINENQKGNQLDAYVSAMDELLKERKINVKEKHFVILAPNYSSILKEKCQIREIVTEKENKYILISYKDLYDKLSFFTNIPPYNKDALFTQFVKSLARHTKDFDDGLYETTIVRFLERIEYMKRKREQQ